MATSMQTAQRKRRYTEDDLKRLPSDGYKYELVNGKLRQVPTGGQHGWLEAKLMRLLTPRFLDEKPIFGSSTGFRMAGGNIRSPDLAMMERTRLPEGKIPADCIDGAPDLAVEIISPSECAAEIYTKRANISNRGRRRCG